MQKAKIGRCLIEDTHTETPSPKQMESTAGGPML
jgi:hypothetical protein